MGYIAIKDVRHMRYGLTPKGQAWLGDEREGARLARMGLLKQADVQVQPADPSEAAAENNSTPSSASPAAPASLQTTAPPSGRGGKRKKGAVSSS